MNKKTFIDSVVALLVGMICGVIMHFSMIIYFIIFGLTVAVAIFIGRDIRTYSHNEKGNFKTRVVVTKVIIANVGVVIGLFVIPMAF